MSTVKKTALGSQGLIVPNQGLGCMGMTKIGDFDVYGKSDEQEAIATIHRSLELGGNFLDTADLYGPVHNERLLAKAIAGKRDQYIIASKFGYEIDDNDQLTWQINGRPEYARKAVERSLKNLNTDYIDLYYLHRLDPNTPVEETVGALSEMVKEGKIGYIGLSEVSAATIRKAHAIHPLTAVQSEFSLFERGVEEAGIPDTLKELGIGFVAYSPLGRGFLTGTIQSPDDFADTDFRKHTPRFQGEFFYKNLEIVEALKTMAGTRDVTASQLAIAWIASKGAVAIPGTKRRKYLEENLAASAITLSTEELAHLESIAPIGLVNGDRYDAASLAAIDN